MKKIVPLFCAMVMLLSSCGPAESTGTSDAQSANAVQSSSNQNETSVSVEPSSIDGVDTAVGLKNIKIDTNGASLTDGQKKVIQFFDTDYLSVYDYEFLRRYPNIFTGTQMTEMGCIYKVLKQDDESYEALMGWGYSDDASGDVDEYGNWLSGWDYYGDQLVLLRGSTDGAWLMDNDFVSMEGRYTGIETITVDGASYTLPVFDVHKCTVWSGVEFDYGGLTRFSYEDIKEVAKTVFGEDVNVREATDDEILSNYVDFPYWPVYCITLENQSNANFSKYLMDGEGGMISDISSRSSWDDPVQRYLEFAPDFQHYFLYTYDTSLENLTLAYYDTSFNKLWTREFEDTTNAVYDYTQTTLYLIANNTLYIIDLQTGTDVVAPKFVGMKTSIRKISDGIVLLGDNKSDGLMKCDLSGEIIWTANLPGNGNMWFGNGVQFVNNNLVLGYTYESKYPNEYGWADRISIYCLYDLETGNLIQSGETISS